LIHYQRASGEAGRRRAVNEKKGWSFTPRTNHTGPDQSDSKLSFQRGVRDGLAAAAPCSSRFTARQGRWPGGCDHGFKIPVWSNFTERRKNWRIEI
jgi:hypothetical protein